VKALLLAAGLALTAAPALAQSVKVTGPGGRTATLTAAELEALPQATAALSAHGERHLYVGPRLIDVLAKVGAPVGVAIRGPEMADAVVVEGADGYRVVFGLAETDPGLRADKIILADRVDGSPIGIMDGPLRLVVEGDLRPARSVRMVTSIELLRLPAQH
jgi:hypothetical protein